MLSAISHFWLQTLIGRTIIGYILMFTVPTMLPTIFVTLVGIQGLRHLFSYEPRQTIIHKLDPRLKVLYPFIISTLSVFLSWQYVFALLGLTLIPWILLRPSAARARVIFTMIVTPAIGLVWSQGLFYVTSETYSHLIFAFPPTVSWFGTPGLSSVGLIYGAEQAGRVMVGAASSLILLLTTKPSEIIWVFYKFRLPASVGLAFTAALRFVPQLAERTTVLIKVMQVRGYDLSIPRWWQLTAWPDYIRRAILSIPIVTVPLLIGSLRATSTMAMVVDARAFSALPQRTTFREHQTTRADIVAYSIIAALIITVIVLVALHIANR